MALVAALLWDRNSLGSMCLSVEVEVQVLCGLEVRLPSLQVPFRCQYPCNGPECPVAVVGQPFVLCECNETVGECSPQEFGGNQFVAAPLNSWSAL